jgi:hypothetical protein
VRALKRVVLPALGLPSRPRTILSAIAVAAAALAAAFAALLIRA